MSNKKTIKKLDDIIALSQMLNVKATGLRSELAGFNRPATPKRAITKDDINDVILKRKKHLRIA